MEDDVTAVCLRDQVNWQETQPAIFVDEDFKTFKKTFFEEWRKKLLTVDGYLFDEDTQQWFYVPGYCDDFVQLNEQNYLKEYIQQGLSIEEIRDAKARFKNWSENMIPIETIESIDKPGRTQGYEERTLDQT